MEERRVESSGKWKVKSGKMKEACGQFLVVDPERFDYSARKGQAQRDIVIVENRCGGKWKKDSGK